MPSQRPSSRVAGSILLALVAGCGGVAPTGAPGTPSATTPAATSAAQPSNAPSAAASTALPVYAPGEPLLLFSLRTDLGGGIWVSAPDGSGRRRLGTDGPPGIHKAPEWSPDGRHVVFVEEQAGMLLVAHLDGAPTDVLEACRSGVCDNPAWSPDGGRIAFTRLESAPGVEGPSASRIEILDVASGAVTTAIRLERPLLADAARWSPDGTELVVQVDRMDEGAFETGAAIAIVPAGGGEPRYLTDFEAFAGAPDWSWATNEIAYAVDLQDLQRTPPAESTTFDLFAIRPDGTGTRRITSLPTGGRLHSPRWTPDGRGIVAKQFDHGAGGSRLVDPATGLVEPFRFGLEETRPLVRPGVGSAPAGAPWLAYQAASDPTALRLVRGDGTGDHAIEGLPAGAGHPDWSPDGSSIAFVVDEDDSRDIWIANADGTDAHRVVGCEAPCVDADGPAFSPDGRFLAYRVFELVDGEFPGSRIEITGLGGLGGTRTVSTTTAPQFIGNGTGIRWAPDGRSLVFDVSTIEHPGTDAERVIETAIAVVRLHDGPSAPLALTNLDTFPTYPDWSPDGETIVFMAQPGGSTGPMELFLMAADGSGLRQLTTGSPGGGVWGPTFAPDGRSILVTVLGSPWTLGSIDVATGQLTPIPGPIPGAHPRLQPIPIR